MKQSLTSKTRMTALGQVLTNGGYTKEAVKETVSIVCTLSKERAEQVANDESATILERIFCKGLVKAYQLGKEAAFRKRLTMRFGRTGQRSQLRTLL